MRISDWSSDVCSSDLYTQFEHAYGALHSGVCRHKNEGRQAIAVLKHLQIQRITIQIGQSHIAEDYCVVICKDGGSCLLGAKIPIHLEAFQLKTFNQGDRKSTRLNSSH